MRIFQKGFNYSQDGPGNRLVYHLKGCNMHCPWCSNPEGMSFNTGDFIEVSAEDIVSEVLRSRAMLFNGGGVTFTGGEATCQHGELNSVLRGLKQNGINTALETNGTYEKLPELFRYIDHLMIDLKHPDTVVHQSVTGVPNDTVKQNIIRAVESHADVTVRVPLIGGFNNDEASIKGFLDFFSGLCSEGLHVEVLKYHEYGKDKWKKCGLEYKIGNAFVSEKERMDFEEKIRGLGIKTVRT